jgi:hypothetical protein
MPNLHAVCIQEYFKPTLSLSGPWFHDIYEYIYIYVYIYTYKYDMINIIWNFCPHHYKPTHRQVHKLLQLSRSTPNRRYKKLSQSSSLVMAWNISMNKSPPIHHKNYSLHAIRPFCDLQHVGKLVEHARIELRSYVHAPRLFFLHVRTYLWNLSVFVLHIPLLRLEQQ